VQVRCGTPGDEDERELEQPEGDRDPLDRMVGTGPHHQDDAGDGDGDRGNHRHAEQLGQSGDAAELGQQRADAGHAQCADREPGPAAAEGLADQFAVPLLGRQAEAHRQFLHHEQDRDQHQLQHQQLVAPLGAALGGRDDAAGVGVGEHDHQAGAEHGQESAPGWCHAGARRRGRKW